MFNLNKEDEERALAIHRKSIVIDTHNDAIRDIMEVGPFIWDKRAPVTSYDRYRRDRRFHTLGERGECNQFTLPRIKEGGIDCLIFAMYVSSIHRARLKRLLQMLDVFYSEVEKNLNEVSIATSYKEIMDVVKSGKVAALISVEGGEALEGDIGVLRMLYKLGVRLMTLTHHPRNELGDGARGDFGSHLTDFGVAVVEEMNRLGMLVDVSHLNETGFWDVIEKTKSPIIASHSNCKALCDNPRNLTDEQIRALAKNGGVVNLSYCGPYIKAVDWDAPDKLKKVSLEDWFKHLDHVVSLVGPDYAGLGSDAPICGFPEMNDLTKVPNITRGLVARGYSDQNIEKILGGNNLRLFKEVLK